MSQQSRPEPRGWGGRKSKGARVPCTVRFPVEMHALIMRGVDEADYSTMQDFIVDLVTAAHQAGLFPTGSSQEQLPLGA